MPGQKEGLLEIFWLSVIFFFGLKKFCKAAHLAFLKNSARCGRPQSPGPVPLAVLKQRGQAGQMLDRGFY